MLDVNVEDRISVINNLDYDKYSSLVPTHIQLENNFYVYAQEYIKSKKYQTFNKKDFLNLAYALEYFERIDFIHGDLNKKNIIYTEDGFKVVDLEPSLRQNKNAVKQLMVTIPYVPKIELKNKKLTVLTDKLGFIFFLLRVDGFMPSSDVIKLSKSLNHEVFLLLSYSSIVEKSYIDLLDYVVEYKLGRV